MVVMVLLLLLLLLLLFSLPLLPRLCFVLIDATTVLFALPITLTTTR